MSMEDIRAQIDPFATAERCAMEPKLDLRQWPIELHGIPVSILFFHRACLLMASGCAML
jgi:hypothetical protein